MVLPSLECPVQAQLPIEGLTLSRWLTLGLADAVLGVFVVPDAVLTVEGGLTSEVVLGTEMAVYSLLMMKVEQKDNDLPINRKHSTSCGKDCLYWNYCRKPMCLINCFPVEEMVQGFSACILQALVVDC